MQELDVATIAKRSVNGVFALISRTFIVQLISLLLFVFLSPDIYGVFFIVSAIIPFLSYFSDIGLAAALVQKKEPVTEDDLKTTFTIQQVLVLSIVITSLLLSNQIASFYRLEAVGVQLFQALVIAFFLSSLKTIPSVLLERHLHFRKLVLPQIVETFLFNVTVLILVLKGFGVTSFTYAVLVRGISGLATIYIIAPWIPKIGFSKNSAKKLLSFGLPFQINSIMALLKDDLLIIYLGRVLPLAQVGYIGFAQKWAFMPLRLVMDNVIRITFPSFSRLSHDKENLSKGLEKALFASCFLIFPASLGLIILFPHFVSIFPKFTKWEPALISLSLLAINAAFSSISTPLTNALNAIGKIKITLYLMVGWTVLTWGLTPLFIYLFGFNGFAFASAVISLSVIIVVFIVKRYIEFNILEVVKYPALSSLIMGAFLYSISGLILENFAMLVLVSFFGLIVYLGTMFVFSKKQMMADISFVRQNLRG